MTLPTLFWCAFGSQRHLQEAKFSLLTAQRAMRQEPGSVRTVVVTDHPEVFERWIGVDGFVYPVDEATLKEWRGPDDYLYRIKIKAFQTLMGIEPTPLVMLDSDTYFLASPASLMAKLQPGFSLMDCPCEKIFSAPQYTDFAARLTAAYPDQRVPVGGGRTLPIVRETLRMWISGIVGLHPADAGLLNDVLHLSDDTWRTTGVFNVEQYAFTHVLTENTTVAPTSETVAHYWDSWVDPVLGFSRRSWTLHQFQPLLDEVENLPLDQALDRLGSMQIRPLRRTQVQRAKSRLRRLAGGFLGNDSTTSSTK